MANDTTNTGAAQALTTPSGSTLGGEMLPMPGQYFNPTHVVTVEVKFEVEIDVEATSEKDADEKAVKEAMKKYLPMTKSSMSDKARRMQFDPVLTEEYVDEI